MSSLGDACIGCQGDDDDVDDVVGVIGLLPLIGEWLFSWVYILILLGFDLLLVLSRLDIMGIEIVIVLLGQSVDVNVDGCVWV